MILFNRRASTAVNVLQTARSAVGEGLCCSATELLKFDTPVSSATGYLYALIPNDGVRFEADPYITLTNVTSVTFFYG